MKVLTLAFLLCGALLLAACGSSNTANSNATNTTTTTKTEMKAGDNTATKTETKTETKAPETTTTTAGLTGVASCDEYLGKVEKCLNSPNVPEAARSAFKQSYEQNRNAWKAAASTPEGKASLETSCQKALEMSKASFDVCK